MTASTVEPLERVVANRVITILVIDDHRSFAELLAGGLNAVSGMQCVGIATTADSGVARAVELQPTIVVTDIGMPGQDGLSATRRIREVSPHTLVAVVTAYKSPEWIARAVQAGASAFISKDGSMTEMIDILSRMQPGEMLIASSAFDIAPTAGRRAAEAGLTPLTHRELQVLCCLGKGLQSKSIAKVLSLSVHTCRGYIKSLHIKLGVSTQLEAVIKAQALGLIGWSGDR